MKKQHLILVAILISGIFTLHSCKKDKVVPDADKVDSLTEIVNGLKTTPQSFTITDPTTYQSITGTDGTVINFQANAFYDDNGDLITTPISIGLNEFLSTENMIRNNAQTTSGGQILVTGGSFDLTAKDVNGDDVNINPWSVSTQIPVQTDISGLENDMKYYTGTRTVEDGREIMDWVLNDSTEWWMDSTGLFNVFGLDLGLSNCDVLFDMASEAPTQFEVSVDGVVSNYNDVAVWVIIEDFPSVIQLTSQNNDGTALETYTGSIPLGMNATLLAIHPDEDGYLKFGSLAITVAGDDSFIVSTDYGTMDELSTLISTLTN